MLEFDYNYTPTENFKFAQESLASTMDDLGMLKNKLMQVFPTIISAFKANDDFQDLPSFKTLTKEQAAFVKHLNSISYSDVRELRAYVPEGLDTTYIEYMTALKPAVIHLRDIVANVLNPYCTYLAELMSNKTSLLSIDPKTALHDDLEKKREALFKEINACFSKDNFSNETKISKVAISNNQWHSIFENIKFLTDTLRAVDKSKVKQLTSQCEDYLEIIYANLKNDKEENTTPEVANALAKGAYQIACDLEFFSIVYYKVLVLETAINNTIEKTNETLS
jgi:hypothetical protein